MLIVTCLRCHNWYTREAEVLRREWRWRARTDAKCPPGIGGTRGIPVIHTREMRGIWTLDAAETKQIRGRNGKKRAICRSKASVTTRVYSGISRSACIHGGRAASRKDAGVTLILRRQPSVMTASYASFKVIGWSCKSLWIHQYQCLHYHFT